MPSPHEQLPATPAYSLAPSHQRKSPQAGQPTLQWFDRCDTYNDILWRCANLRLRNSHCTTPMLYEELLIPIFREIIMTVLNRNPSIVRECITALKAVSNTPTAFNKRIILNSVTANTIPTVSEKYMWRTVIEKVIVHPGHLLEFHLRNGTILPYQMFQVSPRMCRLSKPAQEEIRKVYTLGESIRSIAQRFDIPEQSVRTAIQEGDSPRRPRTTTCLNCGIEFQITGKKVRKYCCVECYQQHQLSKDQVVTAQNEH